MGNNINSLMIKLTNKKNEYVIKKKFVQYEFGDR